MLTDTALQNLKPKAALYKVTDRGGMYVTVSPAGTATFRYDYRLNGRRETLIGRYGSEGLSLARAREKCIDARRAVVEGQSPSQDKQREKRSLAEAKTFGEFTDRWAKEARMADSTRSMRKSISRPRHPAHVQEPTAHRDHGRRPARTVQQGQGQGSARNGDPRARHHQANLRLRHLAWREGGQSGR